MSSHIPQLCSKAISLFSANRRLYVLVLLAVCSGCGDGRPQLFPVRGAIVFRSGEPVRNATIEFIPGIPGPSPRGITDTKGQFTLGTYESQDGAPAGEYQVVVVQVLPPRAAENVRNLGEEHAAHGGRISVVSVKYASPETSDLACTVKASRDNEFDLIVEPR